ncbi:MAG: RusA family crossover junction endodeoxyribonuclease [Lentisphaeria bacterium]|nr:RusA family crossover junction endodeoxyribonuclease [Lentisphaeria bacterium]
MITLELPFPPSVNHYYRHVGPRVLISREGRNYRERVASLIKAEKLNKLGGDVELRVQLYPPDRRRRDVDNVLKVLLDTFTIGGLYNDDSQVKRLAIEKLEPMPPDGLAIIRIKEI